MVDREGARGGTGQGIEREVIIGAPVRRVWELVSRPGWFIGGPDGGTAGQKRSREGDLDIVEDPRYGRFAGRLEAWQPPRYLAYRWAALKPGEALDRGSGTLVEFWVEECGEDTRVRVLESGFDELDLSDEERRKVVEGNTEGWRIMMDVLRKRALSGAGEGAE